LKQRCPPWARRLNLRGRGESQDSECVITVNDTGPGLADGASDDMPPTEAVSGRGVALMRLVTDRLQLRARRGGGLSVRMFKRLKWSDGALGRLDP
jgi:anti-sigma regulatory factor (Ser/Thr protein kinase)